MGTKTIRLDENVDELLRARKREDETFSEAVERLVGSPSLRELAGILSDEEAEEFRRVIDNYDREIESMHDETR
jgi:predicted CopG family antitoxin